LTIMEKLIAHVRAERPDWTPQRAEAFVRRALARTPRARRDLGLATLARAVGRVPDADDSYLWAACGDIPALPAEDSPLVLEVRAMDDEAQLLVEVSRG
jgi:hypothetical protein